jgi:hypothetical protein
MSVFESVNETARKATKTGENYLKASREYYQLKIFQQLAVQFSAFCKISIIGGILFLALVFLATAGAIALGNYLDSPALGCLFIGAILLLFSLIAFWNRKAIDAKVIKILSVTFFDS